MLDTDMHDRNGAGKPVGAKLSDRIIIFIILKTWNCLYTEFSDTYMAFTRTTKNAAEWQHMRFVYIEGDIQNTSRVMS